MNKIRVVWCFTHPSSFIPHPSSFILLEVEPRSELELPRRRRRRKAERRSRRSAFDAAHPAGGEFVALRQRQSADGIVDALKIRPVKQIETFGNEFERFVFAESKPPSTRPRPDFLPVNRWREF